MDCTSDFQDEKLTIEPICNTRRTSWGRSNLSCRFRSNGASVSATMVRHGYAVDYRQHSGLAYARFMKDAAGERRGLRSEEHTSEIQSLMRRSYAVFCL